ncbi:hypothetical protein N5D79_09915 [Pseudomonas sp. GD03817]|uniref:hypothetical protein n=1 Tax=Pseudomonas TaxID=286 RepID=UPI000B3CFE79|nr:MULTISPECIES: hypothetical protein [Pseudomonas]EKT4567875.1 hypothetical protein [Pseudomonas putida]MCE0988104.1 hypothetical protein [Pseudomonas alloputida]MCE1054002.1 hypothetical protein [Pseudomonas alloputida]MDH1402740.1 hypothetical protein [Pseudomonas sp. GD03730]MDH1775196.1 hypothetical protein [Pseudomonas sp. GD03817]
MKKILPDPHHHFDLPSDKTLTNAVSDGIVPIDHVVKITHYLMLAYNHCHRTLDAIEDDRTRESLVNGLRAMQIAWGQADALSLALERSTSLH